MKKSKKNLNGATNTIHIKATNHAYTLLAKIIIIGFQAVALFHLTEYYTRYIPQMLLSKLQEDGIFAKLNGAFLNDLQGEENH